MILNLHGYKGNSENTMYKILRDLFPDREIISPQLDYDAMTPFEVRKYLEAQMSEDVGLIIGTSLGGFYALDLWAKRRTVPAILLNPALRPWEKLSELGFTDSQEIEAELKSIMASTRANAAKINKDNLMFISGKSDTIVGRIDPLVLAMSYEELCQTADYSGGGITLRGVWQTINLQNIDCGHSASGNIRAIDKIKEIILTLHHNDHSNLSAIKDKKDYYIKRTAEE